MRLAWLVLTALAAIALAMMDFHPLAMFLYFSLAARRWARGELNSSIASMLLASATGVLFAQDAALAGAYLASAAAGGCTGNLLRRRAPLWWCVFTGTAGLYALLLIWLVRHWAGFLEQWSIFLVARAQHFEELGKSSGNFGMIRSAEAWRWMEQHWADLGPGALFGLLFCAVTLVFALVRPTRQEEGTTAQPLESHFAGMRPPEYLVWLVILVGGLWVWDHYAPQPILRMLSWNSAIALLSIYGLNGLSILVFALGALQVNLFFAMLLVFAAIYMPPPFLASFGLFDTWANFRVRIALVAQARREDRNGEGS